MTWANLVTLVRLALIPFVVLLFLTGPGWLFFTLLGLVLLGDLVDGALARRHGQVTELGKILDPLADKLLFASLFAALAFENFLSWWAVVLLWLPHVGLLLGGLVLYRASRLIVAARLSGKVAATVLALGLVALLAEAQLSIKVPFATELVYLGIALSYLSGLDYLLNAWRLSRAQKSRKLGG
jgi:CDP-diacylglycerol--glycerol-3-phosphate 3-phosphatidyltransferase